MTDIAERLIYVSVHGDQEDAIAALEAAASEIKRLRALLAEAKSCLERGAYDLRQGGYLRSATILEECAAASERKSDT